MNHEAMSGARSSGRAENLRRFTAPLMLVFFAAALVDVGHDADVRHQLVTQVLQR